VAGRISSEPEPEAARYSDPIYAVLLAAHWHAVAPDHKGLNPGTLMPMLKDRP